MQQLLVEEREDANAKAIQLTLKSNKQPKAAPAAPAKAAASTPAGAATPQANPNPTAGSPKNTSKGGKVNLREK